MAAKKVVKKSPKSPVNKSAFVRSLPSTMPGAEVVAKAKAQGIKISLAYVYGIRAKTNAKKRGGRSSAAKRGPGRPPSAASPTNGAHRTIGGLVGEIERIVEAKVAELLKARLGSIFR
jgi:hypothetical protein